MLAPRGHTGPGVGPSTPPTPRQAELLTFLREFIAERGYPPTAREIGAAYGWAPQAVADYLGALRKRGLVTWEPGKARTLRVLG
jgi:repressor LexA